MGWRKDAISDGEIDALRRTALATCNDDTRYPGWRGSARYGGGHCYCIARWLVSRLGGHIGAHRGHYVWLSPDDQYLLDLSATHRASADAVYARNTDYARVATEDNERTHRFTKRADRIFDHLDTLMRLSLDYGGDAYPAEETQRQDDRDRFNDSWIEPESYWHDEPNPTTPEGVYQFVYANSQLEVSPNHSHEELAGHASVIPASHTGPFASGHVVVSNGRATWEVAANINLHAFVRILKEATKNYGWSWGGMTDAEGQPIIEDFAPKKSATIYHYSYLNDHLFIGTAPRAVLTLSSEAPSGRPFTGTIRVLGNAATVDPDQGGVEVLPALFDWAADNRLTLYAGNDNVIKTIPDLQQHDNYNPTTLESPNPVEPPPVDERLPSGLYRCPGCTQLFPNWHEYSKHRPDCAEWADPDHMDNGDRGLPEPDHGLYGDGAHFTEQRQEPGITTGKVVVLPARTWREAARVDGFMRYATAFGYANDDYRFYVAYRHGDPLGYAAVGPDGNIQMMHAAVENEGIGTALYSNLTRHYDSLYTHAAHDKTASLLQRFGWVQSKGQLWRWAKDQSPKDLLDAPVPFIYDVQDDTISVGHPGARTSDIPGRFTPGGIVEGHYEPGGKIVIRSLTSIPYTVRHMVELWYYTHPQLEVKSVHLKDDAGKDTRLAHNVGQHIKQLATINPSAHRATTALQDAGGKVYVVGGAVRDVVMGHEPKDIDLMVSGLPEVRVHEILKALPGKVAHEGRDFKVFHYGHRGHRVEVALPRVETSTGPGHKDFEVKTDHTLSIEDDLVRRDFTANAMAVDLITGELIDRHDGQRDISNHSLRTVTTNSFAEDPLRIMRALVAYARHGLLPDPATKRQMEMHASALEHLPAERIQTELDKLFEAAAPAVGIRLAHATGALKFFLPEVEAACGYDQNNPHHEHELGEHLIKVLERITTRTQDPDLRLAALLHDIGKPGSAWVDPVTGGNHYYAKHITDETGKSTGQVLGADHELLGAKLVRERLRALKYPNDRIARIAGLVELHMFAAFTTERGARRFLARSGDHADDLMLLRWADNGGKDEYASDSKLSLSTQRRLIARVREAGEATSQRQLVIDGHDLIKQGFAQGPLLGRVLSHLTDRVIDDPGLNERATLLRLARDQAKLHVEHS